MLKMQLTYRKINFTKQIFSLHVVLLWSFVAMSQTSKDTLPAVTVSAIKYTDVSSSPVPLQQLNKNELGALNSLSVADAAKYFSGVQVKDYGGVGGLKTISVRSLGANHTGVSYDGLQLSDAQGGQIDLGKLSLDNIETIVLYNGQPNDLLAPARSFSFANVLALRTSVPQYDSLKPLHVKASVRAGSFGFVNPALLVQYYFNKKFYNSIGAEWQRSDGAYKYRPYEAGAATTTRQNSDMNSLRMEYDAGYAINDSNTIKLKAYYYKSQRGLPGTVVLFNTYSAQRLNDENFFIQSSWKKHFSKRNKLLLSGKYTYNYSFYLDPVYPNTEGKMENKFHQNEYYFSAAYSYDISKALTVAYSSDVSKSTLTRKDDFAQDFAFPKRFVWLNNVSAKAVFEKVVFSANILYSHLNDKVKTGNTVKNINAISPSVAVSYQPTKSSPLRLRFFYKDIFRAPTFNDLYYTFIGNTDLVPEYVKQYNLGATYKMEKNGMIRSAVFTIDAYYNSVKNKILAVPRQNLFQWTMLNIGKVRVKGVDATVQLYPAPVGNIIFSTRFAYTYQQALDVSDKDRPTYKKQIPYTPEHSGSIHINAAYEKLSVAYNVLLSGYRYRLGDATAENIVKEWATQDLSASYTVLTKKNWNYKFFAELNNIFNKQYEVIRYYPMPGINYRAGMIAAF